MLSVLVPLILQVGIAPAASPVSAVPPELRDRPARGAILGDRDSSDPAIAVCLDTARTDPARARTLAEEWVGRTTGLQRAAGRHCLGVAAGNAGDWAGAARAFTAARDEAGEPRFRARMGVLAGAALLSDEKPAEALAVLDAARPDAASEPALAGALAIDRATALVALDRPADAAAALAEARAATPDDAQAWLLSATLARRTGDLAAAQQYVERAAALDPRDPAVGLEAGVIAALGQRDEAAARSFRSVIAAAPDSPQAAAARGYLAQLGVQ